MGDLLSGGSQRPWIVPVAVLAAALVAAIVVRYRRRVPRAKSRRIAGKIIADRLNALRRLSYAELLRRRTETNSETEIGPDGWEYQVETQIFWDEPGKKGGNLRVTVSVDGGGINAFKPLLGAFIVAADGSFVGEGA